MDRELARRAVEESDALVVSSQRQFEALSAQHVLPSLCCVFPDYKLGRELPPDERHTSAEANIGLLASVYEALVREPIVGTIR